MLLAVLYVSLCQHFSYRLPLDRTHSVESVQHLSTDVPLEPGEKTEDSVEHPAHDDVLRSVRKNPQACFVGSF